MRRWNALAGLVLASVVLPSIGSAGSDRHRPFYDVSLADVGTWDAVVTVRLRDGRFETRHAVEVNTVGCAGTCVESVMTPALDAPDVPAVGRTETARRRGRIGADTRPLDRREGYQPPVSPDGLAATSGWGGSGAAETPTRTAIAYPSPDRRVLTIVSRVRGADRLLLRVEYTRRAVS
jgi:hypothetical protein